MRALFLITLLAACSKTNPYYCEGNPDNNCLMDADINAPQGCTTASDCTNAAKPICELTEKVCVACTADMVDACGGTTPVCSDTNECVACTSHDQCESNACLPDGSCAMESQVAYVSASGTGEACTKNAPCPLLKSALGKDTPYVKIAADGAGLDSSTTVIDGKAVTILADKGAKLDRDGDGPILEVKSANADVKIYDLRITGAGMSDAVLLTPNGGIPKLSLTRVQVDMNQGSGISASGGALAITQSTISRNTGGGVSVLNGTFIIVGNMFFLNGTATGSVGGVSIQATQNASNRLDFNSFNQNQAQAGVGAAVQCIAGTFTARNNIMSENGTLSNMEQVGGTCMHAYSIARPGTVPSGPGNSDADPMFVNTTTGDLHIMNGSPAMGAADPASDLTGTAGFDVDGQLRNAPADIGADEIP